MFVGWGMQGAFRGIANWMSKENSLSTAKASTLGDIASHEEKTKTAIEAAIAKLSLIPKQVSEEVSPPASISDAIQQVKERIEHEKVNKIAQSISLTTQNNVQQANEGVFSVAQQVYETASTLYAKGVQGIMNDFFIKMSQFGKELELCHGVRERLASEGRQPMLDSAYNSTQQTTLAISMQSPQCDIPVEIGLVERITSLYKENVYAPLKEFIETMNLPFSRVVLADPFDVRPQSSSLLLEATQSVPDQPQCSPLDIFAEGDSVHNSQAGSSYVAEMDTYLATAMGIVGVAGVVLESYQVYKNGKELWLQRHRSAVQQIGPTGAQILPQENKEAALEEKPLALQEESIQADSIVSLEDLQKTLDEAYERYQEAMSSDSPDPEEIKRKAAELSEATNKVLERSRLEGDKSVDDVENDNACHGG